MGEIGGRVAVNSQSIPSLSTAPTHPTQSAGRNNVIVIKVCADAPYIIANLLVCFLPSLEKTCSYSLQLLLLCRFQCCKEMHNSSASLPVGYLIWIQHHDLTTNLALPSQFKRDCFKKIA